MLARDAQGAILARAVRLVLGAGTLVVVARLRASVARERSLGEEREQLLETLRAAALTDELTGLPNRRAWEEQFRQAMAEAAQDGRELCVAMLDFDGFKAYNDRHGHRAGDELLIKAARAWSAQLRAGDLLARHGGEEFALLIRGCDELTAATWVERIREATPPARTVSAGLAAWDGRETPDELLHRADTALYFAKSRGRDRAVLAAA